MKSHLVLLMLVLAVASIAQNPIVPPGVYIADPAAHVWEDGKLFIYGSRDESPNYYCSWRHHVMVTEDMHEWTIHRNTIASKGPNDQVPYNDALLYAPDCMVKDDTYYLYISQPSDHAEGVATSSSPVGPFMDARPIDTHGYNQIDPAVFIDDDGQAYYMWGQFTMKMAKLKPNMMEIDETTIRDSVITEMQHHFHEGAFMTKRNGIYYLVYADLSRADMPTCIGYATSESPFGPYTYGGVIVDNDRCDPGNWNNHGSIAEFNGQWYVFYHRATHNSKMMRKACVEPITFEPDGSIPEVEMTSQGVGGPLPAMEKIDAGRACTMLGNIRIQLFEPDNEELGEIRHDDRAVFKYIDFADGVDSVTVRVKPGGAAGILALKQDMPWGPKIADVPVPAGTPQSPWRTITAAVNTTTGVHALWLQFWASERGRELDWSVDWLRFQ